MIELSSVLSDLRRQFGIARGAEVPRRLVADAITRRLMEQERPDGGVDLRSVAETSDPVLDD